MFPEVWLVHGHTTHMCSYLPLTYVFCHRLFSAHILRLTKALIMKLYSQGLFIYIFVI